MTKTTYTYEAKTDEVTTCWQCGKTHLKGTVVLRDQDGNFVFFGTTCAARALGRSNATVSQAKTTIDKLSYAREAFNASVQNTIEAIRDRGMSPRRCLPVRVQNGGETREGENSISNGILTLVNQDHGFTAEIAFGPLMKEYRLKMAYEAKVRKNEELEYASEWLANAA